MCSLRSTRCSTRPDDEPMSIIHNLCNIRRVTLQNRFKGDSDEIDEDNRKLGVVHESVIWYNKATMSGNQRLIVMSEILFVVSDFSMRPKIFQILQMHRVHLVTKVYLNHLTQAEKAMNLPNPRISKVCYRLK